MCLVPIALRRASGVHRLGLLSAYQEIPAAEHEFPSRRSGPAVVGADGFEPPTALV